MQFTSGFSMIFFVLALAHAMGIQEMVVRDTEDALEREALEDISSNHLNTRKMDMAHHNATGACKIIHTPNSFMFYYFTKSHKNYFVRSLYSHTFISIWFTLTSFILDKFSVDSSLFQKRFTRCIVDWSSQWYILSPLYCFCMVL